MYLLQQEVGKVLGMSRVREAPALLEPAPVFSNSIQCVKSRNEIFLLIAVDVSQRCFPQLKNKPSADSFSPLASVVKWDEPCNPH